MKSVYNAQCFTAAIATELAGDYRNITGIAECIKPPFCLRIVKPYRTQEMQQFRDEVAFEARLQRNAVPWCVLFTPRGSTEMQVFKCNAANMDHADELTEIHSPNSCVAWAEPTSDPVKVLAAYDKSITDYFEDLSQ